MRAPIATWTPGRGRRRAQVVDLSRRRRQVRVQKADDVRAPAASAPRSPWRTASALPPVGRQLQGARSAGRSAASRSSTAAGRVGRTIVDQQERRVRVAVEEREQRRRVEASGFVVAGDYHGEPAIGGRHLTSLVIDCAP